MLEQAAKDSSWPIAVIGQKRTVDFSLGSEAAGDVAGGAAHASARTAESIMFSAFCCGENVAVQAVEISTGFGLSVEIGEQIGHLPFVSALTD